jgi:hypothetical protein
VLDAPEAFLFSGGNNLALAHEASRRVAVVGIEAENYQGGFSMIDESYFSCQDQLGKGLNAASAFNRVSL